jgi:hypothetical protein
MPISRSSEDGRSFPSVRSARYHRPPLAGFPSGQRDETVNLAAQPSQVRILPPPLCCVSGHPGRMSREIVDGSGLCEWLVVAVGVERELAYELAGVGVDDADVEVGDEELDCSSCVGSADADVV